MLVDEHSGAQPDGELLVSWEPRPGNPFHGSLLRTGSGYAFWASDAGWYLIDPAEPSIRVAPGGDLLRRELRLFGVPTAVCAFEHGDISVHASAVEIDGLGVLIAGPSMYGKTTLAAAFARSGHRLLSEDTTRCDVLTTAIYPGPAVLRLRSDVADSIVVPGARRVTSQDDGRVPLLFDERHRRGGGPVPLRAILILREPSSVQRLESVNAIQATRDVMALAFRVPGAGSLETSFGRIVDLTARTETLYLHRPLTLESLDAVVAMVARHVTSS